MIDLPTTPLDPDSLGDRGIADALDRAARLIETEGLATGEYWTGSLFASAWASGRGCCAVGAIGVATGHRDLYDIDALVGGVSFYDVKRHAYGLGTVHPALAALMRYRGTDTPLDVMNWSDRSTDRAVVQEMRACAANLRIQAGPSNAPQGVAG